MGARGDVRFEVLAADVALRTLREPWREWSRRTSPFGSPAFFAAWHRAFGEERTAFVLVGRRAGVPAVLLPLFHTREAPRRWSSLGAFRADYSEACAADDDDALGHALWAWLESGAPCESTKIARMPERSLLGRSVPLGSFERRGRALHAATSLVRFRTLSRVHSGRHDEHPFADAALIAELSTRLHERNVKRKVNMLGRMGAPPVYEVVRGPDMARLLPAFFDLHVANFRGTERVSQFEAAADRSFYGHLVRDPELADLVVMDVLRVAGRPVAMHLGFEQDRVFYYYKPAFDLALGKASPGRILLAFMFERAHQQGMQRFELLKGNEGYKSEWTNHSATTITTSVSRHRFSDVARRAVHQWRG